MNPPACNSSSPAAFEPNLRPHPPSTQSLTRSRRRERRCPVLRWITALALSLLAAGTVAAQPDPERALAAVLMGEARGEGVRGMTAVAEVVRQRAREKHCTVLEVISAERRGVHAFSCINGTTLPRLIQRFSREPAFYQALKIAETTCRNPEALPGLTKAANHYTRVHEQPYWARGRSPIVIIGRHAFYRIEAW